MGVVERAAAATGEPSLTASVPPPRRLVLLIRSLGVGGSERQVLTLAQAMDRLRYQVTIVTYRNHDGWTRPLPLPPGVACHMVGKRSRWDIAFLWRLARYIRHLRPDCVYSLLTAANVQAMLCRPFLASAKLICSVRDTGTNPGRWAERILQRAELALLRHADAVITNSHAARALLARSSHGAVQAVVIPNGIDTGQFHPDPAGGKRMRHAWQIPEDVPLIGLVARLDLYKKNHAMFLQAAARMPPPIRFVCIGDGPAQNKHWLLRYAQELHLGDRVHFAGEPEDMPAAYSSLTLATLTSRFEGLPNGLAEAMACGIPCVATDVGDVAVLLADTGLVVPSEDPVALAAAWQTALAWDQEQAGARTRQRIVEHFSAAALAQRTAAEIDMLF